MAETMLKITDLVSSYGNIKALKGISLEIEKGEIVSLLGANGAGKSTLMKSILGMVKIEGGSIKFKDQELVGKKSHEIVPMGISLVPEGRKIFIDVSVEENLNIGTFFRKRPAARDKELRDMVYEEEAPAADETFVSPVSGKIVPLSEVSDPTFASGTMGKGFAVIRSEGKVVAPLSGTIATMFPTKHAVGITADNGTEILIHVGIDTVELNGEHFEAKVKEGDKVKQGQTLITFDKDKVAEKYDTITPVVFLNTEEVPVEGDLNRRVMCGQVLS